MGSGTELEDLNSVKYLFLRELTEPQPNSLRLVVEEAIANRAGVPGVLNSEVAGLIEGSWPIESVKGCKKFEILWNRYVAYLVTEEMSGSCGRYEDEIYTGRLLRVYSKSHFMEHLSKDTGGHVAPLHHFKLICQNHLIDIASYSPPQIRLISSQSSGSNWKQ